MKISSKKTGDAEGVMVRSTAYRIRRENQN